MPVDSDHFEVTFLSIASESVCTHTNHKSTSGTMYLVLGSRSTLRAMICGR